MEDECIAGHIGGIAGSSCKKSRSYNNAAAYLRTLQSAFFL